MYDQDDILYTRDMIRTDIPSVNYSMMIMCVKETKHFWDTGKQFHLVISKYAILCS